MANAEKTLTPAPAAETAEALFAAHQAWAERIARQFCRSHRIPLHERDAMLNSALIGLWAACLRYEPRAPFKAFGRGHVEGAMMDELRQSCDTIVHYPRTAPARCAEAKPVVSALEARYPGGQAYRREDRDLAEVDSRDEVERLIALFRPYQGAILRALAAGDTQLDIARRYCVTESAISCHMRGIRMRLNARNN